MSSNDQNPHFVALAVDSIVYAPLFIAHAAGLFEELHVEFGIIKQNAIGAPDKPGWLGSLYPVLKDSITSALLVVCDPLHAIHVNRGGGDDHAATIGSLVVRPTTWMFDSFDWLEWEEGHPPPVEKIVTYPRGMTSDTLLRFCLAQTLGLDQPTIDDLITNVDVPGAELAHYRTILAQEATLKGKPHAIVTMDLLELLNMSKPMQHYIVHDFKNDFNDLNYPMTALVVPHAAKQSAVKIQKILDAVNIALELCRKDAPLCTDLLRRHYETRRTGVPNWNHPRLTPLAAIPLHHEVMLPDAFGKLLSSSVYPVKVDLDATKELIDTAWMAYRTANEHAKHPALEKFDYDIDPNRYLLPFDAAQFGNRRSTLHKSLVGERDLLFGCLQRQLAKDVREFRPHPDSFKVLEFINSRVGQLACSSFKVIDHQDANYMCHDEGKRMGLRYLLRDINEWRKRPITQRDPFAVEVCGDPGCGKSTFVTDVQDELRRQGFTIPREKVDVSTLDDLPRFRDELVSRLREISTTEPSEQFSSIFVDEINKSFGNLGERVYAFNALLGYLQPDKGKEVIETGGGRVDLRNIVWFFAGAHAETGDGAEAFLKSLDDDTGGRDYNTRISVRPPLPQSSDPLEAMISSIGMMKTKAPRLEEIDPQLLFSLAVTPFKHPRARRKRISEMFSNEDQKRLALKDAWDVEELTRFSLTYAMHLKTLNKDFIKLT